MQYYSGRVVKPDQTKLGSTKPNKQKTRQCYAGAFDIDSNDFVQMMVIDGCFVLELLRLYNRFEREVCLNISKLLIVLV